MGTLNTHQALQRSVKLLGSFVWFGLGLYHSTVARFSDEKLGLK